MSIITLLNKVGEKRDLKSSPKDNQLINCRMHCICILAVKINKKMRQ